MDFLRLPMVKQAVNQVFLTIFCFAFLLQQVYAFSFLQELQIKSGKTSLIHTAEFSVHSPFVTLFPVWSAVIPEDMELLEEDDSQGSLPAFFNSALHKATVRELFYDRIVRNRYQQLESSARLQAAVPLFILHHSWRSFLA
jgi:hypothetical protein